MHRGNLSRMLATSWYQPMIMYGMAAVIAGVLDTILIFFVARAIYGRASTAFAASLRELRAIIEPDGSQSFAVMQR